VSDEARTDLLRDALGPLPGATRNQPRLVFEDERGRHEIPVDDRVVLGASPSADVVVADPRVSRIHCELVPREDGLWVRDLSSSNGTHVDGVFVEKARLADKSLLRVGTTDVRVVYDPTPLPVDLWPLDRFGPLVGRSVVMRELFQRLERLGASDATVLVQGETGTGKELVARAIHASSRRHGGPLVVVDCGALPESLVEPELFGHVRGAFTGATESRIGAIEAADGGVVFLDEVGELSMSMQPKLLRFLESRTVRRVGETIGRSVDVRVIAATHRDLRQMVNRGAFREDLFFRLAVLPITLPPLRERTEDIPLLVQSFLPEGVTVNLGADLLAELAGRPWDGNVRELRNFVDRALALGADEALSSMADFGGTRPRSGTSALPEVSLDVPFKELRDRWINHLERVYVEGLLARHGGNVTAVAQAAGIDRTYVHRLMKKHGL
jgi:transcriptional regulator with GAF, ATPase, and Fis domain